MKNSDVVVPVAAPEPVAAPDSGGGAAGVLAGLIYGLPMGILLTGLGTHWEQVAVGFGAVGGAVIGAMLGRCFGKFQSIAASAAFGAVMPVALILIDAVRRGRFANPRGLAELTEPRSLLILGCIMLGGATIAALLTATAKGIRRLGRRGGGVTR